MAAIRTIAIDFDGVIHRNRSIAKYQQQVCGTLLGDYVNGIDDPQETNAQLYRTYGHTVKILNSFGVDMSYREFNYLLDTWYIDYDRVLSYITFEDIKEAKEWEHIIQRLTEEFGYDVCIFTNAGFYWCEFMCSELGIHPKASVISADMIEKTKPSKDAYDTFMNYKTPSYFFIDDSPANLVIPMEDENWYPMLYTKDNRPQDIIDRQNIQ